MKINIYYGGRGLVEDPTIFVIDKIVEVLEDLRVEVNRYNLYADVKAIIPLQKTIKEDKKRNLEIEKEKLEYHKTNTYLEKEEASKRKKKKKITYVSEEEPKKQQTTSYLSWLSNLFSHKPSHLVVAEEKEEYVAEPIQAKKTQEIERTILLSTISQEEEVTLVCSLTGEIIPITKFPFYIGSTSDYVDYVLTKEGVSRIHCCISKKGESYYLADLNSTNGTYLNKKEVMPGKDELLSVNDEIRIASVEFYIKFSCH